MDDDSWYDRRLSTDLAPAVALVRRFVFGEIPLDGFVREYLDEVRVEEKDYPAGARELLQRILHVAQDRAANRAGDEHEVGRTILPLFWQLAREHEEMKKADDHFAAVRRGTSVDIEPLLISMQALVAGEIDARTFDQRFWEFHRAVDFFDPPGMYPTMQEIFYAAEDYVEYDHLRDPGDLDDDGLRARIAELEPELRRLYEEARAREATQG